MYDMLPFPRIVGKTSEEQIAEINLYLIQFKETLEFILSNISTDNLSDELINKLNSLGAEIERKSQDVSDHVQQVSNKALTLYDVINSELFNTAVDNKGKEVHSVLEKSLDGKLKEMEESLDESVKDEVDKVKFTVNFDTGLLEYTRI